MVQEFTRKANNEKRFDKEMVLNGGDSESGIFDGGIYP